MTQPLPCAPFLRLVPAPDREPPFDDEIPPGRLRLVSSWDRQLPFEDAPGPALAAAARTSSSGPVGAAALPDPDQWGRRFLIALLETAAGRRPINQLSRHTTLAVLTGLRSDPAAIARLAPQRRPGSVRTVRSSRPAFSVAEFSAVIQVGPRYRAVAARFESYNDSWRCVRLQIG
jgi:hypothetical protein